MIYFTSDLHLGHESVICMQNRPFANADEMNRVVIENYNSVVYKDDTVYLLGDICFRIGVEKANELIASLKGKKYLIRGNHDKKYDKNLFENIRDFMTISVNGLHISLMHLSDAGMAKKPLWKHYAAWTYSFGWGLQYEQQRGWHQEI